MKAKFWIIGCFVACLCLSACGDDKSEATVKSIAVTPATVSPLEVGGTVELTAVITPADATDPIKWVSEDPAIVSVAGTGTKATVTAIKPGTTHVFATNQAGVVSSNRIEVTVNQPDYAGIMLGNYVGTGALTGGGGMFDDPNTSVQITVAREGDEKGEVKMNFVAVNSVLAGMGIPGLPLEATNVVLSPAEGGKLTLQGQTVPHDEILDGLWFSITGTFDTAKNTFSLELVDGGPAGLKIVLTATKAN